MSKWEEHLCVHYLRAFGVVGHISEWDELSDMEKLELWTMVQENMNA